MKNVCLNTLHMHVSHGHVSHGHVSHGHVSHGHGSAPAIASRAQRMAAPPPLHHEHSARQRPWQTVSVYPPQWTYDELVQQ
jgi:hypothetical protein